MVIRACAHDTCSSFPYDTSCLLNSPSQYHGDKELNSRSLSSIGFGVVRVLYSLSISENQLN
eukprot:m.268788 g.268788  ORF g.268788 m.268788 type:complete len:62 (+) comp17656_c0_seq5:2101-2286(+)